MKNGGSVLSNQLAALYGDTENLMHGGVLQDFISRYFGPSEPNHSFLGELNLTWYWEIQQKQHLLV